MFWDQFWPNFSSVIAGLFITVIISIFTIRWQMKNQNIHLYIATLKTLLSEAKENSRVLEEGELFHLVISDKTYDILLTMLGSSAFKGSVSSERLNHFYNYHLSDDLVLLIRKIDIHNKTSTLLMEHIGHISNNDTSYIKWLISNMQTIQKILEKDFKTVRKLLQNEIDKYS